MPPKRVLSDEEQEERDVLRIIQRREIETQPQGTAQAEIPPAAPLFPAELDEDFRSFVGRLPRELGGRVIAGGYQSLSALHLCGDPELTEMGLKIGHIRSLRALTNSAPPMTISTRHTMSNQHPTTEAPVTTQQQTSPTQYQTTVTTQQQTAPIQYQTSAPNQHHTVPNQVVLSGPNNTDDGSADSDLGGDKDDGAQRPWRR